MRMFQDHTVKQGIVLNKTFYQIRNKIVNYLASIHTLL